MPQNSKTTYGVTTTKVVNNQFVWNEEEVFEMIANIFGDPENATGSWYQRGYQKGMERAEVPLKAYKGAKSKLILYKEWLEYVTKSYRQMWTSTNGGGEIEKAVTGAEKFMEEVEKL